jgi:hypothetical protein
VKQQLQQQNAEMPLEVRNACHVADSPSCSVRVAHLHMCCVPGLLDVALCWPNSQLIPSR